MYILCMKRERETVRLENGIWKLTVEKRCVRNRKRGGELLGNFFPFCCVVGPKKRLIQTLVLTGKPVSV